MMGYPINFTFDKSNFQATQNQAPNYCFRSNRNTLELLQLNCNRAISRITRIRIIPHHLHLKAIEICITLPDPSKGKTIDCDTIII
jgi:hypothetical protein